MPGHLFEEVCDRLDQQTLFHGYYAVILLRTFPEIVEEARMDIGLGLSENYRLRRGTAGDPGVHCRVQPCEYRKGTRCSCAASRVHIGEGRHQRRVQWKPTPEAYKAARVLEQAWYSDERVG